MTKTTWAAMGAHRIAEARDALRGSARGQPRGRRGVQRRADSQCTGSSATCPPNNFAPNGTSCDDGDVCTTPDECQSGSCVGNTITCGNTTVEASCGEECDDGNTSDGDGCSADCLVEGGGIPLLPEPGLILFAMLLLGTSLLLLRHRLRSRT